MEELREQLQTTLGDSYRLEHELGGGGMSRVFVAEEASLGRKVVIKVLPPEMAAAVSIDRFRREIQLAARLQHPHIVPLLSAGETNSLPYFTMPFVKGESLRARLAKGGELPVSEAVRILREVASALAYAHENQVVHRDIKPENVLISGGSAMVTDFGVAKALTASSGSAPGSSLTSLGVALGTPAYMAPEQATADPNTDYRADIYAFGVIAYEILTGSTPFSGRSPQGTLAAHVTEAPDPVTKRRAAIPAQLANLVMWCLEKRPADRPQTAAEVVHELDALSTPSGGLAPTTSFPRMQERSSRIPRAALAGGGLAVVLLLVLGAVVMRRGEATTDAAETVPAIAVLPFENRGRAEGQEFTDGMTEEITNRLSSVRGLRVIGRQSARGYAATNKTPQQIAKELGVQYVLTGTVRWDRADGKDIVRVSPALLRTSDATQVWGDAYQTVLSGMFEVQSKVATEVANALNIALLAPEKATLVAKPTENVEAYSLYLRGNDLLRQTNDQRLIRSAVTALERAVALDPKFAQAHARLSLGHTELYWFSGDRSSERLRKAKAAVDRALALNPSLADAHFALGVYHYHGFLQYAKALQELAVAERARPSDFEILFYKAAIQRRQGKWTEAKANMARAIELEPRVGSFIADYANTHIFLREYNDAEKLLDRALIVDPNSEDALYGKARIAIARDRDVPASVRLLRRKFDASPDRAAAAGSAFRMTWPAILDPVMRDAMTSVSWSPEQGERADFFMDKSRLYHLLANETRARAYADSAARLLAERIRDQPDEALHHSLMAVAQAVLGNKGNALAEIDKAMALHPISLDAYGALDHLERRAFIEMRLGDLDAATIHLEQLLASPSNVSRNELRLSPLYAPLRGYPRFQRLMSG
ncbi:MAG TPA: protein kinase [Gemmatimonadaceae bacterium]|nr:protein kinase [Gemmatimonadaceae bacterium]